MKSNSKLKNIKIFYLLIIFFFSIFVNQYYGYIGVFPIDTFLFFDSGNRVLNGEFPIKDFWAVTGLTNDFIQAILFKIFGVSWFSYVLHASLMNFVIAFFTFHTLLKFKLHINFCLVYALLVSIIAYPVAGTPFPDHHSMIFSIIGLFCFLLYLKTNFNFYLFLLPIFFVLGFLSKQTPAAYILIIISFLGLLYFILNFSFKKVGILFAGFSLILTLFCFLFVFNNISFYSFFIQYLMYPITIGDNRILEFLFPLEFNRLVLRFKLIHISIFPLIYLLINNLIKDYKFFKQKDFFVLSSLIFTAYALILNQLLTLNQKFIFFIIPIFLGFSHIYIGQIVKRKYLTYLIIFLAVSSTVYYKTSYVDKRKFMELENTKLENLEKGEKIDNKLKYLKWINPTFPGTNSDEIEILKKTINTLSIDKNNKFLITHYQFIASLLPNTYSFSRTYDDVAYPTKSDKHHENYKQFFLNHLVNKKIKSIYIIKPLEKNVFIDLINMNCLQQEQINKILTKFSIVQCDSLKN